MMPERAVRPLSGLPQIALSLNLFEGDEISTMLGQAASDGSSFVRMVSRAGPDKSTSFASALSQRLGYPLFDLDALQVDHELFKEVAQNPLLTRGAFVPLFRRGRVRYIGVADPFANVASEVRFNDGARVEEVLVEDHKLLALVERVLAEIEQLGRSDSLAQITADMLELEGGQVEEDQATLEDEEARNAENAVIRYINQILIQAFEKSASDIHVEPYEKSMRIRFRIDGVLKTVATPPQQIATRLVARLKVMARLDLAERRVPQDGRIKMRVGGGRSVDFRVSTCPTMWGEKVVLRILDSGGVGLGIDQLGYEPDQKALYLKALEKPQGMILVTGPTGSGKTVSLYTGLGILNTDGVNISTAEDPCEINLHGVNQVNVNNKTGLTFTAALRSFLRQDPDVIMVGEIRDLETAEIAIKAAQTGHLVLSTLHTNDAPQTLTRLLNMGVPSYNVASCISLIIAQRLVRKLCRHCKVEDYAPKEYLRQVGFDEELLSTPSFHIYKAHGCDQCTDGYKGRTGIYQVMPITDGISRIIIEGGTAIDIADQARREGVLDLRQSALKKVADGVIDLREANRITVE